MTMICIRSGLSENNLGWRSIKNNKRQIFSNRDSCFATDQNLNIVGRGYPNIICAKLFSLFFFSSKMSFLYLVYVTEHLTPSTGCLFLTGQQN